MTYTQILVAENETLVANNIIKRLKRLGYAVPATASSGEEAIQRVTEIRPDLVLMDIELSGVMDGIDAAQTIRARFDIPVIYLAADTDTGIFQRAKITEPYGRILMPIETKELRNNIEMALYKHAMDKRLKQSEARYRASAEILQSLVNANPDTTILMDTDGIILIANESMARSLGTSLDKIIGSRFYELIPPELSKERKERNDKVIQTGQPLHYQDTHAGMHFENYVHPLFDTDEKVTRLAVLVKDITKRKQAEQALRQSYKELSISVESLTLVNHQVTLLNEMGNLLQSCTLVEDAYAVTGDFAENLFPGLSGALYTFTSLNKLLEPVATWGDEPPSNATFEPASCWAMRRGRLHTQESPGSRLRCQHLDSTGKNHPSDASGGFIPYLCVPMSAHGGALGILHLSGEAGQAIIDYKQLALSVAERSALAISNLKLREKLRDQSIRDPLTGLFARSYMIKALEREVHRAARHKRPLGVLILDIDNMQQLNHRYGHDAGDKYLQELCQILQKKIRKEDFACRYGVDRFTIIFTEVNPDDGIQRSEQLLEAVRNLKVRYRDQSLDGVTASLGLACFPHHGTTATDVLRAANVALHRAKEEGRNRIVVAVR